MCTTVLPSGKRTGGEIASQSFIDALRCAGHTVGAFGYCRPAESLPLADGERMVAERYIESSENLLQVALWLGKAALKGTPYSCAKYESRAYRELLWRLSLERWDLVIVDHAQIGFSIDILSSLDIPFIFIAHNVERQIYEGQAAAATGPRRAIFAREAKLISALETQLALRAQQVWTLTTADAAHFKACGAQNVFSFGIPAPLVGTQPPSAGTAHDWDIGMIGTWSWEANAQGLRWFAEHVVPHLPEHLRVGVAGKGAEWLESLAPRVTRLGFVDDSHRFLAGCKVVCVPSVAGGGLQIKTIDAIAAGRPTVATTFALRGIEDVPDTVFIADDARAFAEMLASQCAQVPKEPSTAARNWAKDRRNRFNMSVRTAVDNCKLHCNE